MTLNHSLKKTFCIYEQVNDEKNNESFEKKKSVKK